MNKNPKSADGSLMFAYTYIKSMQHVESHSEGFVTFAFTVK